MLGGTAAGRTPKPDPRVRASALCLFPDTAPASPVRRRDGSFVTPVSSDGFLVVVATVSADRGRTRPQQELESLQRFPVELDRCCRL